MADECVKFGKLEDIFVATDAADSGVFLRFSSAENAAQAATSFAGRFYAGRQLAPRFLSPTAFTERKAGADVISRKDNGQVNGSGDASDVPAAGPPASAAVG